MLTYIKYPKGVCADTGGILAIVSCYQADCVQLENEKSYPDLETLVNMSERFQISLDQLLKENRDMVKAMDKERIYGKLMRCRKSVIDFFSGAGTGLVISCLTIPDTTRKIIVLIVGITMLGVGQYKRSKYDKTVIQYIEEHEAADEA